MEISVERIRELRELTGAGMMDCKRALEEAGGDMTRAQELLREKGQADAAKRAGKVATEGLVDSYVHMGRIGALVEVNCETDFVANTEEFRTAVRDVAMQIAALDPWWTTRESVPQDVVEAERKIYETQAREQGKPDQVVPRIVEGKLESFYRDRVLLDQPFFRDTEGKRTVGDLLAELSAKVGEKIEVNRFTRYERGEDRG